MKKIIILIFILSLNTNVFGDDIATSMCKAYVPAIANLSKSMRDAGAPIGLAEKEIYNMAIDDYKMRVFLKTVIRVVYKNPNSAFALLENGSLINNCVMTTRGF